MNKFNSNYDRKFTDYPETRKNNNNMESGTAKIIEFQVTESIWDKTIFHDGSIIYNSDNLAVLKSLPENSVDSIVTDPPYGLKFMGKNWDDNVPTVELWKEAFRVIKPGGHLLSFGASKTYHRMASLVEDAGFIIRDQIMWVYGSGFPKSHNISKAIDKYLASKSFVTVEGLLKLEPIQNESEFIPVSEEAMKWNGYGTNLKPAHEPIVLAMKPCSEKTFAKNILRWGTGALNIDGSRIGSETRTTPIHSDDVKDDTTMFGLNKTIQHHREETTEGRWPANFILDEEAGQILDEQSGIIKGGKAMKPFKGKPKNNINFTSGVTQINRIGYNDIGGASKFFYCPKASSKDRNEGIQKNKHPTVKPTELMKYLIRLVTPRNGIVLDPFFGSGSTGKAALRDGNFKFIGIEKEKEFCEIAIGRCKNELQNIQIYN